MRDVAVLDLHQDINGLNARQSGVSYQGIYDCCSDRLAMCVIGSTGSSFISDPLLFSQACRFCFRCLTALGLDGFLLFTLGTL